jgi:uncharacterized SAM-binding protein YcdF (DUF218 family)
MLSKLIWFAIEPSHLLVWTMIAALRWRTPRGIAAIALTILLFVPVGNWALRPIENQVPRPDWPAHIDGILVLGEGLNGDILATRGTGGIGSDGGTLIAARLLAERYAGAKLVYAGDQAEVATARQLLPGTVLFDGRSHTTWDNLTYAKEIAHPAAGEVWLLVAAAYHLPRAAAVARQLNWPMIPWASDYRSTAYGVQAGASLPANLAHLDLAAHEALGWLAYRLEGEAR